MPDPPNKTPFDAAGPLDRPDSSPLRGARILVTRAAGGADALGDRLAQRGAEVVLLPVIRIADPPDWAPVDAALDRLEHYDWLVFSSVNGVEYLLNRLAATSAQATQSGEASVASRLAKTRIAAVGPATAEALRKWGLAAEVVPDEFRAESLAEALLPHAAGRRFLLARANRGRDVLKRALSAAGAEVDEIAAYSSLDVSVDDAEVASVSAEMALSRIGWVTATSSAIARSIVRLFGFRLAKTRLVSISPVTSKTLRELGYPPAAEARPFTIEGLVDALERGYREDR